MTGKACATEDLATLFCNWRHPALGVEAILSLDIGRFTCYVLIFTIFFVFKIPGSCYEFETSSLVGEPNKQDALRVHVRVAGVLA